jgi:hypothetical protein
VEDPSATYEAFLKEFEDHQDALLESRLQGASESDEEDDSEEASEGCSGDDLDDPYDRQCYGDGAFFEGYGGSFSDGASQLEANFATHLFQRRLDKERKDITEDKRLKVETLGFMPSWAINPRDLAFLGLTTDDFYDELLR